MLSQYPVVKVLARPFRAVPPSGSRRRRKKVIYSHADPVSTPFFRIFRRSARGGLPAPGAGHLPALRVEGAVGGKGRPGEGREVGGHRGGVAPLGRPGEGQGARGRGVGGL